MSLGFIYLFYIYIFFCQKCWGGSLTRKIPLTNWPLFLDFHVFSDPFHVTARSLHMTPFTWFLVHGWYPLSVKTASPPPGWKYIIAVAISAFIFNISFYHIVTLGWWLLACNYILSKQSSNIVKSFLFTSKNKAKHLNTSYINLYCATKLIHRHWHFKIKLMLCISINQLNKKYDHILFMSCWLACSIVGQFLLASVLWLNDDALAVCTMHLRIRYYLQSNQLNNNKVIFPAVIILLDYFILVMLNKLFHQLMRELKHAICWHSAYSDSWLLVQAWSRTVCSELCYAIYFVLWSLRSVVPYKVSMAMVLIVSINKRLFFMSNLGHKCPGYWKRGIFQQENLEIKKKKKNLHFCNLGNDLRWKNCNHHHFILHLESLTDCNHRIAVNLCGK